MVESENTLPISENTINSNLNAGKVIKMKNNIEDQTSQELLITATNSVIQLAHVTIKTLREKLGIECDITQDERDQQGNYMYHINKKGVPLQDGDGQIILTVTKKGKINVRFNVYGDNPEYTYYHAEGFDTKDFIDEISAFNLFLSSGVVLPTSNIKKDSQSGDYSKEDMDEWLREYE
ncbi:MAG: hypothetical protein NTY80_02155 [candidate division SR1 bacterium]|nr:hypothetical protein [candidate division SR1 bacterium]